MDFLSDFFAGGFSAIVSKTAIAPIERVKLLLQTQHVNNALEGQKYKGLVDCFKRVYQEQGLFAFWRGNFANIFRFFPNHALTFAVKDKVKIFFIGNSTKEKNSLRFYGGNLLSAGVAGGISLMACHPIDIMRTQLAADVGKTGSKTNNRIHSSYYSCARSIYKKAGWMGFYQGFGVSLTGVVIFKAFFLGGYDISKAIFAVDSKDNGSYSTLGTRFLLAQGVTTVVGIVLYPLDTIRRRMMMQTRCRSTGELLYTSGWICAKKILKDEGIKGYYVGYSANFIRGIGGALLLVGYDEAKPFFKTMFLNSTSEYQNHNHNRTKPKSSTS